MVQRQLFLKELLLRSEIIVIRSALTSNVQRYSAEFRFYIYIYIYTLSVSQSHTIVIMVKNGNHMRDEIKRHLCETSHACCLISTLNLLHRLSIRFMAPLGALNYPAPQSKLNLVWGNFSQSIHLKDTIFMATLWNTVFTSRWKSVVGSPFHTYFDWCSKQKHKAALLWSNYRLGKTIFGVSLYSSSWLR